MNYLDLFHGIGGFAIGAYMAGMKFDNHFCSDIEPYCQKLYALRFPDSIQLGDITKIDFEKLKNDYPGKWIITGGFPCQDISIAGKGAGIEGKRSGLWFEMWRAIRILRPEFAIIENVSAITFRGLDTVLSSLAEIGYDAEWQDIRANDMGAPHKRERIWIVAYSESIRGGGLQRRKRQPKTLGTKSNNREQFDGEVPDSIKQYDDNTGYGASEICRKRSEQTEIFGNMADSNVERLQELSQKQFGSIQKKDESFKGSQSCRRNTKKKFGNWWTTEPAVGCLVDGIRNRVDRLKGLGNSIVPQIACLLFQLIKEVL